MSDSRVDHVLDFQIIGNGHFVTSEDGWIEFVRDSGDAVDYGESAFARGQPETVFSDFRRFVETIHSQLPGTWIYYIAFAFQASLDSHEDVRAVRGNGNYGGDISKEQNSCSRTTVSCSLRIALADWPANSKSRADCAWASRLGEPSIQFCRSRKQDLEG